MHNYYSQKDIEQIIPGEWYRKPKKKWNVETVTISKGQNKMEKGKKILFIAIDSETWHKGSQNKSIYAGWTDTHETVKSFENELEGIIVQRPIPDLDERIPQYVTTDTYQAIKLFANHSYHKFNGKSIAITGTAGKSTTKNLLEFLISKESTVIATRGNHNTRTGVPLTIACAITQPDYLIVESAISGLWTSPHGIMNNYPPDIAMITSIDGGQNKSAYETAIIKAKICEAMNHNGTVILNRDMQEYDTLLNEVNNYNSNILTYGFHPEADSFIKEYKEVNAATTVSASILGEEVNFETKLIGRGMIQNIIGVLTNIKLLGIPLQPILELIPAYKPKEGVLSFEQIQIGDHSKFTLLDDSWNATGIAMIEAIELFGRQSKYHLGKNIAILGRIENLGPDESKRQHEALVQPLINSNIDLVFAHGPEMKHTLKQLPSTMIGGYFEDSKQLAQHVANLLGNNDFVLLKGSPRSSDFKYLKKHLINFARNNPANKRHSHQHPFSSKGGAATFELSTNRKVGEAGNQDVIQNQGVGNVLLIHQVLDQLFANQLNLTQKYLPGKVELKANNAPRSITLRKDIEVSLNTLLNAAIVNSSPNALLMIAHQATGGNSKTINLLKETALKIGLNESAVQNITGRRITNKEQKTTLQDLYLVGKLLFNKYPLQLDLLSQKSFIYNEQSYNSFTNLYHKGMISHGLFFGHLNSIAIVLSQYQSKQYITVVAGANDAFHRDQLIIDSLQSIEKNNHTSSDTDYLIETTNDSPEYTMNIIGDTYFGEFYTDIRNRRNKEDALSTKGRAFSFDKLRSFISDGDFNICNFEGALSKEKVHYLKQRKPFVLYADPDQTVPALKDENIHLATLANNHLMDCGEEGLRLTIEQFKKDEIHTIGAGEEQESAEKPFVKMINGKRIAIFNAYWYRNPMYREFDFYAIGDSPGVACLSGHLFEQIENEKANYPEGMVLVIAHWGADFKTVSLKQREYAHSLVDAGADLIIGHGAHMIQEIEKVDSSLIVYSIGNGVFNSNGEYHIRYVAPYSMIAQLKLKNKELELRLYPIFSNNLETFWQPRFLNEKEFKHCTLILNSFGSTSLNSKTDEDNRNYYSIMINSK